MLEFATALVLMQRFRCKDHVYAYCDGEIAAVLNCFNSEIEINAQYWREQLQLHLARPHKWSWMQKELAQSLTTFYADL